MQTRPAYPTPAHARAAAAVLDYFATRSETEAVLLVGSTARGKATRDSCLDMAALVAPDVLAREQQRLDEEWRAYSGSNEAIRALPAMGAYSAVELDIVDGQFSPGYHGWTSGPDNFELEIGNTLVYSIALWQRGDYLARLKARWLPYYADELRRERLAMVRRYCLNNLDHIALYVERGLYFQCFDRLYNAYREFLQALFIARRAYPIAYDKWIREQVEEILGLPELYHQLPGLFEIHHFESKEIAHKAETVRLLLATYTDG